MGPLPRRIGSLALAAAFLLAASCSPVPHPRAGRTTIAFWTMPFWIGRPAELQKLVDDFNVSQNRVTVELTVLDWQTGRDRIKDAVLAGNGPDIWLANNGLDLDYLQGDRLAPLETLGYTPADLDKFLPLAQVDAYDGKLYGVPLYFDVAVLLYRTDILRQYGFTAPPRTWTELKSVATAITNRSAAAGKKVNGWQFKGMDDHLNAINATWESLLCQAGGSLTTPDSTASAEDSDAGRLALNYMRSFYADHTSQVGPSALDGFVNGNVAMFSFYQSVISDISAGNEKTRGTWAVAPMPEGPKSGCSSVGGHSLVARSHLADPSAAGTFMRWLASPLRSTEFMEFHGIFPYDTAKTDPEVKTVVDSFYRTDPSWAAIQEQLKRNTPALLLQDRHGFQARWEAHKNAIPSAAAGRTSVEKALADIDDQVDRALPPHALPAQTPTAAR